MKTILFIAVLLGLSPVAMAQKPLKSFREGNKLYQDKKYEEAGISYMKGLEADSMDARGLYNMANTIYKLGEYEQSAEAYNKLLSTEQFSKQLSKSQKADAFHNLGNASIQKEDYENGIKAYKEALKLKPNDAATKYNLAYALQKMQQQQQQNQQNQDQNQDKKDQKDQQKQQQQQPKDQQQNKDQKQQQQPQQPQDKIKKSDAERMLNAMDKQEKNTLEKKKKIKVEQRVRTDKDW
ncbi:MAG: tetratricopeptide repeat protein [Bacteroidales bacterium]|jgi:hypothetical protein|nr:tetratricopeptide repeat protein [Bacteroidales bacterium]